MADNLKLARPYMIALAIVALGRWVLSLRGYPYEKGTDKFSIVILTMIAAVLYGAFARRFCKYTILQAAGLGATLALIGQIVVVASTLASYAIGRQTYFNHPLAVGIRDATVVVPFATAVTVRAGGLVVNVLFSGVLGAIGWAFGRTLPE
jgi:hypothetical protein